MRRSNASFRSLWLAIAFSLLGSLLGTDFADPASAAPRTVRPPFPIDLTRYDRLLETHTRPVKSLAGTAVDYAALARSKELDRLVAQVEAAQPSKLGHDAFVAYWIDAYNILTLDLVRRHLPLERLADVGSFLKPARKQALATIEGRPVGLDTIEREILAAEKDPRIHAALVPASKSAPPLRRRAFRPERLDADLDAAMRAWIASPGKGVAIDRRANEIHASKLFERFSEDFEASGGLRGTVARYAAPADAAWLRGPGRRAKVVYFEEDETLNDR